MMDVDFNLFRQAADNTADERNVAARFYDKAVKTEELTPNGLPIFKNVTYVEIHLKDNSTEVFNQPASEEKIKRFPREYAIYKMAKEKVKDGTPLNQFAFLTAAEVATCYNRGVMTVEELAALPKEKTIDLGLVNEAEAAKKFMARAAGNQNITEPSEKEKEYLQQIEQLKAQIKKLQARQKYHHYNKGGKR